MKLTRRTPSAVALTLLASLLGVASLASAQTDNVEGVTTSKRVYVIGRDTAIDVQASVPIECAGREVVVELYARGGGAAQNVASESSRSVRVTATSAGEVIAQLPLPHSLPSSLLTLWPGVSAECLAKPLVSIEPGLLLSLLDREENPGNSGTFVVPARVVDSTGTVASGPTNGDLVRSLTVYAGDIACVSADLTRDGMRDRDRNVRIHVGGTEQPDACSADGAVLSFRNADGFRLFEGRTLLLGVTQPFGNLAPDPVLAGGALPPAPPATGGGSVNQPGEHGETGLQVLPGVALAVALLSGLAGIWLYRRPER